MRLFYAVVLYRLESLDEAERAFKAVAALDIPQDVRDEIDRYLAAISLRQQRTRYTASLSFGAHYDSNRTAAPRSGSLLFLDNTVTLRNGRLIDEEDDIGFLGIGSIRVDHDLGYQERHALFGALTYYHDDQVSEDTFDIQSFDLDVGGVYRQGPPGINITPTVFMTHLSLSRQSYFREIGLDVTLDRRFGRWLTVYGGPSIAYNEYNGISETGAAPLRDGRIVEVAIGARYVISPTMSISGDYTRVDKDADADFFAFDRDQVRLSHSWLLGEGQFLLTNASYQRDRYDEADIFISARERHDDIVRIRLTYGAPLGFFVGKGRIWEPLEDITLSGSAEYLRSNSNIRNFDYENWRGQLLMTKTWRF